MMGWCMGGLFCLLYQGQTQDPHMRNIVTVASPIDLESGGGVIAGVAGIAQALEGPAQLVRNSSNLWMDTLDPALLSTPPWMTTLVFKLTDPIGSVTTYWDLVTRLSDREFVESHSTTSDYLNHMLICGVMLPASIKTSRSKTASTSEYKSFQQATALSQISSRGENGRPLT